MSPIKLEYCDGEIYAMAGGTPAHADLSAAAVQEREFRSGDVVQSSEPALEMAVDELYAGIQLET
jgi:hypothetical protein